MPIRREQAPVQAGPISPPAWQELEESSDNQVQFAGVMQAARTMRRNGEAGAELLQVAEVSGDYFEVMGATPAFGRALDSGDQDADADSAAVVSAALAQRLFGSASSALGQDLRLDDQQVVVVGVMPSALADVMEEDLWLPARFQLRHQSRGNNYIRVLARLQPGFAAEALEARLAAVVTRWESEYPESHLGMRLSVHGLLDWQTRDVASMLWLLQGAVLLVLAVACANVANLALARLAGRRRELATEAALGAGRAHLMAGSIAEAVLLGLGGLVLGLLLAHFGLATLKLLASESVPRLSQLQVGPQAWTMAVATTVFATAISGLLPAWATLQMGGAEGLRGGRQDGADAIGGGWRQTLVAGQLALSALLLVSCLLVLLSLSRLAAVDPGFDTSGVLTGRISLPAVAALEVDGEGSGYERMLEASVNNARFLDDLLREVRAIPGVEGATAIDSAPLTGNNNWNGEVSIVGRDYAVGTAPTVEWRWVSPTYFDTIGVPVSRGRLPSTAADARETVINQRFADEQFAGVDPIGERVAWWNDEYEIVGVVGDVRQWSLGRDTSAEMYFRYGQAPSPETTTLILRTGMDPLSLTEPLRRKLQEVAPDTALFALRSMQQIEARSLSQSAFVGQLLALFAVTALLVSAVGLYGLLSFSVARRGQELGVRLALGATPAAVRQLVLNEALKLSVIGIGTGLIGAYFASRLLASVVYQPGGSDALAYLAAGLALAMIAAIAAWTPAARAAGLPPMRALRAD